MRFRFLLTFGLLFSLATSFVQGEVNSSAETSKKAPSKQPVKEEVVSDIKVISEAFGHLVAKQLSSIGIEFDWESLIKGLNAAFDGKEPPIDEAACIQALTAIQEKNFQKQAEANLTQAEAFMKETALNPETKEIPTAQQTKKEIPLLLYQVTQKGDGKVVEEHSSPLLRYKGTSHSDGKTFANPTEEQRIHLDDTVPGFKQGIIGMQEGEKRTIFIHPELGFKDMAGYLPPNTALIFEVEVIKADVPAEKEADAMTTSGQPTATDPVKDLSQPHDGEVAATDQTTAVR